MGACADECKSEFQVTRDKRVNGALPARSGVPGVAFDAPGVILGVMRGRTTKQQHRACPRACALARSTPAPVMMMS